jgi:hypothetical protein
LQPDICVTLAAGRLENLSQMSTDGQTSVSEGGEMLAMKRPFAAVAHVGIRRQRDQPAV